MGRYHRPRSQLRLRLDKGRALVQLLDGLTDHVVDDLLRDGSAYYTLKRASLNTPVPA